MNVHAEIERYSQPKFHDILLWLFERNHTQSEWNYVAHVNFVGTYPNLRRAWVPNARGLALYFAPRMFEALSSPELAGYGELQAAMAVAGYYP